VALGLRYVARRISRRLSNDTMTFGYPRRGSPRSSTTPRRSCAVYLVGEGSGGGHLPSVSSAWFVIDIATAALTASPGQRQHAGRIPANWLTPWVRSVIVAGTLIILFDWRIVDPLVTLASLAASCGMSAGKSAAPSILMSARV
jgi:cobalt-zinc-cadmium efflux system protein